MTDSSLHASISQSEDLQDFIDSWCNRQYRAIAQVHDDAYLVPSGQIEQHRELAWHADEAAQEDVGRWAVTGAGNSPAAWTERNLLFASLFMDRRSRRFGRIALDPPIWIRDAVDEAAEGTYDQPNPGGGSWAATSDKQMMTALVFAQEWQRYLRHLLFVMPRESAPPTDPIAEFRDRLHPTNDSSTEALVAIMAHCRPAGAFFELLDGEYDEWIGAGGRPTCRRRGVCPHCWARWATRLIGRVEQGPMKTHRRGGYVVMFRTEIPSAALELDEGQVDAEREKLFGSWLRFSPTGFFGGSTPEEAFLCRLELQQTIGHTLTPCELGAAKHQAEVVLATEAD